MDDDRRPPFAIRQLELQPASVVEKPLFDLAEPIQAACRHPDLLFPESGRSKRFVADRDGNLPHMRVMFVAYSVVIAAVLCLYLIVGLIGLR